MKDQLEVALKEFCLKFKRLPAFAESFNGQPIGRWRWRVSNLYFYGKLNRDLKEALKEIPHWEYIKDEWYSSYELLEGHLKESAAIPAALKLWLERQSDLLAKYQLDLDKAKLLDSLPIVWKTHPAKDLKLVYSWFEAFSLFKEYTETYGSFPTSKDTGKETLNFNLYDWLRRQRVAHNASKLSLVQQEHLKALDPEWYLNEVQKSFIKKISFLKSHFKKNGSYPDSNGWVVETRMRYRQGKLPAWKAEELEQLQDWEWTSRDAKFIKSFETVKDFILTHNYLPSHHTMWKGINVGTWLISARTRYREGSKYRNEEKAKLLESLPLFKWDLWIDSWKENLTLLKTFLKKKKRYPRAKEIYKGIQIGSWLCTQRARYHKNALSSLEYEELNSLPDWSWSPLGETWDSNYQDYKNTKKSELSGFLLRWERKQRSKYQKGILPEERIKLLEEIPHWCWSARKAKWNSTYTELKNYVEANNDFPSSTSRLGRWIYQQLHIARNGKLDQSRKERLEKLPHWDWNPTGSLLKG